MCYIVVFIHTSDSVHSCLYYASLIALKNETTCMYVHCRYSLFHLSHAGSIAECIKQKLPYADVRGVDTEDDIVSALSSVPSPITLEKKKFGGLDLPINQSLGCFIRGAGTMYE